MLAPKSSDGHNIYGVILAREGHLDEAVAELQRAVDLAPRSGDCHYNLGRAFAAASLTNNREPAILQMLAAVYSETGRYQRAIDTAQRALDLATARNDTALITALRSISTATNIRQYKHLQAAGPDLCEARLRRRTLPRNHFVVWSGCDRPYSTRPLLERCSRVRSLLLLSVTAPSITLFRIPRLSTTSICYQRSEHLQP